MEKQEFKSKWDELAREIGAEVPAEIEQREQPVSTVPAEPAAPPPARHAVEPAAHPPLPKKAAADWDNLANQLGLPPDEGAATTPTQPSPGVEAPETAGERPPRRERADRGEASRERRERSVKPRERRENREAARELRGEEDARSGVVPTAPSAPVAAVPPESRKPAPAVSLWHKIFGSPAEQAAKAADVSTHAEAPGEDVDERDQPQAPTPSETAQYGAEATAPSQFVEAPDEQREQAVEAEEAALSERKRGRPRRRRRGGRGRKSDERRTGEQQVPSVEDELQRGGGPEDEFDDITDELGVLPTEDEAAEAIDSDAEVDDGDAEVGAARSARSKAAAQRSIPSWQEAIGFIVDSNLQNRSQRRPPSRSDSRANSSRGRPRGRRKK